MNFEEWENRRKESLEKVYSIVECDPNFDSLSVEAKRDFTIRVAKAVLETAKVRNESVESTAIYTVALLLFSGLELRRQLRQSREREA